MWYSSKCLGDPNPGLKRWLRDEGYEELFQLYVSSINLKSPLLTLQGIHRRLGPSSIHVLPGGRPPSPSYVQRFSQLSIQSILLYASELAGGLPEWILP